MVLGSHVVDGLNADHVVDIVFQRVAQCFPELNRSRFTLLDGDGNGNIEQLDGIPSVTGIL